MKTCPNCQAEVESNFNLIWHLIDMIKSVAKAHLHNYLTFPSAKADGNKKLTEMTLMCKLPFTLVNGFLECRCLRGFNPML